MEPILLELNRVHFGFLATIEYGDRIETVKVVTSSKKEAIRILRSWKIICPPRVYEGV